MPLQMSDHIRAALGRTHRHGEKYLQKFNEYLSQFPSPWDDLTKTKFRAMNYSMTRILETFDKHYEDWQKFIRSLDDKEEAKVEEQILIEWIEKPEFDNLIYDLNDAVIQIEVSMKRKINGDFQGEVPTNNIPSFTEEQVFIGKHSCVEANKEIIQVYDTKASKSSLMETMDPSKKENSENSTTKILSIEPVSPQKKTFKRTKALEKSNATLMVEKADCKKVASVENEARQPSTTVAEFQRQNKYDRPPSQNFPQQRPNIDEQTSGKVVQPKFLIKSDTLCSRAVFEHSNVAYKHYPTTKCGREGLPAHQEQVVEKIVKLLGRHDSTKQSQCPDIQISTIPSSKQIKSWKDKPPECFWEANTLTPSTNL